MYNSKTNLSQIYVMIPILSAARVILYICQKLDQIKVLPPVLSAAAEHITFISSSPQQLMQFPLFFFLFLLAGTFLSRNVTCAFKPHFHSELQVLPGSGCYNCFLSTLLSFHLQFTESMSSVNCQGVKGPKELAALVGKYCGYFHRLKQHVAAPMESLGDRRVPADVVHCCLVAFCDAHTLHGSAS